MDVGTGMLYGRSWGRVAGCGRLLHIWYNYCEVGMAGTEASARGSQQVLDVVERAVVALRRNGDLLRTLAPCAVTCHLPPPESGKDVTVEVTAKLK